MAYTRLVSFLNQFLLNPVGAKLVSLTADRAESAKLQELVKKDQFNGAVYPVPESFKSCDPTPILSALESSRLNRARIFDTATAPDGFHADNMYFTTPDVDVLYAIISYLKPKRFIEVGSGNSTLIARRAVSDNGLDTKIISIDPNPRKDVSVAVDIQHLSRLETVDLSLFDQMQAGDVLFIDSSHELQIGNDVAVLYLQVIPKLPVGVIIHIHDIFLPYEYPQEWIVNQRWKWNEQQLVQAMLYFSDKFEVLWPGHYLQNTRTDFPKHFPNIGSNTAQSLWLRIN